jgi:hypothetical protein
MDGFQWSRPLALPPIRCPAARVVHSRLLLPLARHLGVNVYDAGIPEHWNKLIGELDHAGIATFELPHAALGHAVYVHHVHALLHHWPTFGGFPPADLPSFGWPLGPEHLRYSPRLFWVIVDERQPPQPM